MKLQELHPDILVSIVNAARDISVAKIESQKGGHSENHNFFEREFNRIVSTIMTEVDK